MKNNFIEFIPISDVLEEFYPQPARKVLPQWYKEQKSYLTNEKKPGQDEHSTPATIKKCIPVFDALTTGYIIVTVADLYVWHGTSEDKRHNKYFRWGAGQPIEFHSVKQFDAHPVWNKSENAYKFVNSFIIKTPPGYSCLFTAPFAHINPFKIIDGVVDTDTYMNPINFPFVFIDETFEGMIPAGTPIAQIIPFKRENWQMKISNADKYIKEINKTKLYVLVEFFDRYKRRFWSPKEYK